MSIRFRLLALSLIGSLPLLILGLTSDTVRESPAAFGAVGFAVVLLAGAAALVAGRSYAGRIRRFEAVTERFAERDFSARANIEGADELASFGRIFDTMAGRLEKRAERFNEIDRVKSEFVSSVSHELRTPLTTIKALTRLLMRGELSEEKRREYLETISVECDRQIDLVLNLLDLSRIEGGVFRLSSEKVDVGVVIASCLKSEAASAEKRRHTLRVEPSNAVPDVCADSKALRRVLSNLVENAIKYTPDGGLITLAARQSDGFVEISVADNGRGIPPEDVPRLFDKFHRGRPGRETNSAAIGTDEEFLDDAEISGVGLGLYLARNIVGQMGGSIGVETEVGHGSVFTLRLPEWEKEKCGQAKKAEEETDVKATADR